MESSGGANAAQIQSLSSRHESDLFNLGYPGFRLALSDFITDLGQPGSEPDSVRKAFKSIRELQTQQFDTAARGIPGSVDYQAKASGYRGAVGAEDAAQKEALFSLESRRRTQGQLLNQQETDVAMQQRDFDLGQIMQLSGGGLQSARGFTNNALQAAGYRTGNPWGGALSGAASGAALGSAAGPWGTAIGAVVGGVGGYFGGGGG
jgi:hypothetical protein